MDRISEGEAQEFIDYLDSVEDDMEQASTEASELDDEEFFARWGNYPSRIMLMIGRRNHREFVETVYLNDG